MSNLWRTFNRVKIKDHPRITELSEEKCWDRFSYRWYALEPEFHIPTQRHTLSYPTQSRFPYMYFQTCTCLADLSALCALFDSWQDLLCPQSRQREWTGVRPAGTRPVRMITRRETSQPFVKEESTSYMIGRKPDGGGLICLLTINMADVLQW